MSTHSICFHGERRKIFTWIFLLSGAMQNALCAVQGSRTENCQLVQSFSVAFPEFVESFLVTFTEFAKRISRYFM